MAQQRTMGIYRQLYPFQKNIVDKFRIRSAFGIWLDMGLGKTPISLAMAESNHCDRVIIITINSKATETIDTNGSWFQWLSKADFPYKVYNKWSTEFEDDDYSALVVNYESLFTRKTSKKDSSGLRSTILGYLGTCRNRNCALIVDESHKLKNLQSRQTRAVGRIKAIIRSCSLNSYVYLLTGTPFTTGYIDLYSQLKMLGYPDNKETFTDQFCIRGNLPGLLGWQQPIVGYKNVKDLFRLVHRYAITIKSEEVTDLPDQIFVDHVSPWSKHISMLCNEFASRSTVTDYLAERGLKDVDLSAYGGTDKRMPNPFFRNIAFPKPDWTAETSGTFWLRARQLSIGFQGNAENAEWFDRQRLEQLKDFLENNEDNYVLFYNFTAELVELHKICTELGYNIDVYCGDYKSLEFYETYCLQSEAKQLCNKKNIILANFASGATGMNWQAYSKCIIFSLPVYKDYEQAIKRVHRLGQTETVFYHIFYQNNWLDLGMRKALKEAITYNQELFDSDRRRIQELQEANDEV